VEKRLENLSLFTSRQQKQLTRKRQSFFTLALRLLDLRTRTDEKLDTKNAKETICPTDRNSIGGATWDESGDRKDTAIHWYSTVNQDGKPEASPTQRPQLVPRFATALELFPSTQSTSPILYDFCQKR
jgi:hypothetical protein